MNDVVDEYNIELNVVHPFNVIIVILRNLIDISVIIEIKFEIACHGIHLSIYLSNNLPHIIISSQNRIKLKRIFSRF